MKRCLLIIGCLLSGFFFALAQEQPKTGWTFTPMPNIGFTTDSGVTLGAYGDLFYYGDGSTFPNFLHHAGFSVAYATKGSWFAHAYFESPSLIKGLRVNATVTYRDAMLNPFFGYNGIASPFDPALDLNKDTRTAWYTNHRRFFRFTAASMGKIAGPVRWMGGLVFRHVMVGDFTSDRYDSGRSLYTAYRDLNLIRPDEGTGGTSLELKAGLLADSRDVELSPTKGIYAELYVVANADLRQWKYNYGQLVAHFRQYLTLVPGRLIFAWHAGLQHQLWGEMPFYNLNEIANIFYPYEEMDGLGSRTTVRGIRYNRVAAAGYAWANTEFRITPFKFNLFKQHFDLVLNPFMDLCAITRPYRLAEQMATPYYQEEKLPVMVAFGLGGKLQMNTNFILSVDVGRGLNPQVSAWTVGMATTYVF